ncbi:MAG: penicillin-insensitive murein endopeptidase [Gammaproteobacteria bacterium]
MIVADITAFAIKRIQCEVPGNWRAVLKFTPGGSTIAQTLFDQPFTLASIGPVVNVALNPKEIHPKVNGGGTPPIPNVDAETSHINALVTDSGCPNIPIPDAKVELSSKVIPGSGGHAHIKTELAGTGTFKSGRSSGLTVSGISDLYGKFQATYTAGDLGIKENIIARATVTDSQGMTKTVEGKSELSITVATKTPITPLPAMSPFYVLQQGEEGANNHPQNNYGRPRLNQVIQSVASAFKSYRQKETQQTTVTLLSINDISLPLGGRFEGHGSHEVGVELDINGAASGLAPDSRDYRKLIKLFDGQQCTEIHFIHFRCEKTY